MTLFTDTDELQDDIFDNFVIWPNVNIQWVRSDDIFTWFSNRVEVGNISCTTTNSRMALNLNLRGFAVHLYPVDPLIVPTQITIIQQPEPAPPPEPAPAPPPGTAGAEAGASAIVTVTTPDGSASIEANAEAEAEAGARAAVARPAAVSGRPPMRRIGLRALGPVRDLVSGLRTTAMRMGGTYVGRVSMVVRYRKRWWGIGPSKKVRLAVRCKIKTNTGCA